MPMSDTRNEFLKYSNKPEWCKITMEPLANRKCLMRLRRKPCFIIALAWHLPTHRSPRLHMEL